MRNLLLLVSILFNYVLFSQGNLQFNQVLLVDNNIVMVPAGKVWKIENIIFEAVPYFQANSGSGTCSPCNGSTQLWSNYTTQICQVGASNPIVINGIKAISGSASSPVWLPAGTTLAGEIKTCSPNPGSYNNCLCPPPNVTAKTFINVIEFNIIP